MANSWVATVSTPHASPAIGPYSQAVVHNDTTVFVSGILPITASGERLGDKSFEEQARQVMRNLRAVLVASGSSLADLLSVRVYMTDMADWGAFNAVYSSELGESKPARAVVPIAPSLPSGLKLELEAVAAVSGPIRSRL